MIDVWVSRLDDLCTGGPDKNTGQVTRLTQLRDRINEHIGEWHYER